jgi:hypothetical protein
MHRQLWRIRQIAFAIVVPFGVAAIVAFALWGWEGAGQVAWAAMLAVFLVIHGFDFARKARGLAFHFGWRPTIKPEDRERRREQRERRRRAREVAYGRYGTVVRGSPREQREPDA